MTIKEFNPSFRKGEVIFQEGDPGDTFYVVNEGSVSLMKKTDGGMATLATVGKGVIFGEMALLDGRPRMATAVAAEDSTCTRYSAEHLENRLGTLAPEMRRVFDEMLSFVRETLPWEIRKDGPGLAGETGRDAGMHPTAKPPDTALSAELADPVLDALYNLLKHYVQRRLPDHPPS